MEQSKRSRGRPPGGPYAASWKNFRMSADEKAQLQQLARKWGLSESATIRRLIADAAQRERVAAPSPAEPQPLTPHPLQEPGALDPALGDAYAHRGREHEQGGEA